MFIWDGGVFDQKYIFCSFSLCKTPNLKNIYKKRFKADFASFVFAKKHIFGLFGLWKPTKNRNPDKKTEKPLYKVEEI